jgi:hypothetical protein
LLAWQHSVDRSTISKILIQAHRWTGPPQPSVVPIPKPIKQSGGGRFPAIEKRMDDWMDEQFKLGYEIRDQVARDKAKEIAREMGFTEERFKASAKWLDKVNFRGRENAVFLVVVVPARMLMRRVNVSLPSVQGTETCKRPARQCHCHLRVQPSKPHTRPLGSRSCRQQQRSWQYRR